MHSRASIRLAEALRPKVMSQSKLAEELGVSPQAVSGWVVGKSKPAPEQMVRIEDLFGIPMRAWTEEEPAPASEESES
jgi:transcriptional regulator with XRE-family HTH domain